MIIYWQAWRSGPPIGKYEGATLAAAEKAEADGAAKLAEAYAAARRTEVPSDVLAGVVVAYKGSPEYAKLAGSTLAQWSRWLDRITEDLGTLPVAALKAKGARRVVIEWRNRFAATPRTADYAVQVLRRVLSWAVDNERAPANPAVGIEALYESDRSAEIVEPDEFVAILKHATPAAARFFRMAAATGIRRGDLVRLKWSDINETSIEMATGKSRGRKRIIMPLLDEAREVLADCRAAQAEAAEKAKKQGKAPVDSIFVLTSALGGPWSKDGPTQAWVRASGEDAAKVDKHLHDLRGNFATLLMGKGLSDEQIADLMGWEVADVKKIRRRYVDRDRVALLLAKQLNEPRKNGG